MYEELRNDIVQICYLAYDRGHVAAAHGNVSARTPDDKGIVIKASGVSFWKIRTTDLLFVDWAGGVFDCVDCVGSGSLTPSARKPSMELAFHTALYAQRDTTRAVVHLHSPYATALSLNAATREIPLVTSEGASLRRVPLIDARPAGSAALADAVRDAFADNDIIAAVIRAHGPVAVGRDLEEAYNRIDNLEHNCKVAACARA